MPNKTQGFTWTIEDETLITYHAVYGDILVELGHSEPKLVVVTADLGNSTRLQKFREAFPDRYINVGVAEQNMIAVAAGLAANGMIPVVSSYAVFASLRAAEFIRADLAYNRRNVKILATLAGVSFGQGGPTHHSIEDIALMQAIPGMAVVVPCDGLEAGAALKASLAYPGPVYLRLGRSVEPAVHQQIPQDFCIGKARVLKPGKDISVIACGPAVYYALAAAERAERHGISVRVINMPAIKPLDSAVIQCAIAETRRIITAEDHSIIGGLGSAAACVIAESGKACLFKRLGHPDAFSPMGIPEDLIHLSGFDDDGILAAISALMKQAIPEDDWNDENGL